VSGFGLRRWTVPEPVAATDPELLAAVLERLADAIVVVGADGLVRSNRAARELLGLPRAPLGREDWAARHRAFPPGSARALGPGELPLARAACEHEASVVELEVGPSEARRERVEVTSEPVRRGRHVIGAVSVLRRLPPSDATLHPELLRRAPDGIAVICAETGTFVYTNDAWTNALGYAPGDLAGRHVSAVNAPSDRLPREIAGEMLAVLDRGEVWRGEVELRRRDGGTVWWEQTVSRYDDAEGRPAWIVVGREATARRATAVELGAEERRFHAAFDALRVAAAVCDEHGRVLAVNDALVALTGTGRTELLDRNLEAVLPPADVDAARALMAAARAGEVTRYRYDGRGVVVTTTVVRHVDGRFLEAVVLVEPDQPSSTS
jgi:PAS domain S-box-containing protein